MEFVVEEIDIGTQSPTVLLNAADAAELGAHPLDRVQIVTDGRTEIGIVEVTEELVQEGTLGVTRKLGHIDGDVSVTSSNWSVTSWKRSSPTSTKTG